MDDTNVARGAPATGRSDAALGGGSMRARLAFFAGAAAFVGLGLLTLPGIGDIRDRLTSATPGWIAVAAACSLGSMIGFGATLRGAFERAITARRAMVLGFAEQGANVILPAGGLGGPALGAVVMRRAGVPGRVAAERHAVLFLATSLVSLVALAAAGILCATGALRGDTAPLATLLPAAAAVLALGFAVLVGSRPTTRLRGDRRIARALQPLLTLVHDGARTTIRLLRDGNRWLIVGSVAYYALDVAALRASFEAVGGPAPPVGVFVLAYTLGHAGALLPTPGGVGGTEGGLIGMFAAYGAPPDVATAAVLGYRVFQLGLPAVIGGISMIRIRHLVHGGPPSPEVAARYEDLAVGRGLAAAEARE